MIEKKVRKHLEKKIKVPVLFEFPKVPDDFPELPEKFVVIEKVGGSVQNHLRRESLAFQSYGDKLGDVMELDESVQKGIFSLIEDNEVTSIKLASNYNHTDERRKKHRYQSVFDFVTIERG